MSAADDGFARWARPRARPIGTHDREWHGLEEIGRMVGSATLVALGEPVHGAAEALTLRNALFQYLVENHGFTAIAIESGLIEARALNGYVKTGRGDLDRLLAEGISWTFAALAQNRALIEWIRAWNATPGTARQISFYGYDIVPTSSVNDAANRTVITAIEAALAWLETTDLQGALAQRRAFAPLLDDMAKSALTSYHVCGYEQLDDVGRTTLRRLIRDLRTTVEAQAHRLGDTADAAWGLRAAIAAEQTERWLAQLPRGWSPSLAAGELPAWTARTRAAREEAQADNIDWIVRHEGVNGKIMVFGHRVHLSRAVVEEVRGDGSRVRHAVAGSLMDRRYGPRLCAIGMTLGQGDLGCPGFRQRVAPAQSDSLDGLMMQLDHDAYALDLRDAPSSLELEHPRPLAHCGQDLRVSPARAFDVLVHLRTASPAFV